MTKILNAIYNLRQLEGIASQKSFIHGLNPISKVLITFSFIIAVVSFGKYEITGLLPLFLYIVIIFAIADLPISPIFKRVIWTEPFIICIAILNPIFDKTQGWIVMLSIFLKSNLTVTAIIILMATTRVDSIASALRSMKIPKIIVMQFLLAYRYIAVLIEEVYRVIRAYTMRTPGQKGIAFKAWGSFTGQILIRAYDRAHRIFTAMQLRGFSGEYDMVIANRLKTKDFIFLFISIAFFILVALYNIPDIIGKGILNL